MCADTRVYPCVYLCVYLDGHLGAYLNVYLDVYLGVDLGVGLCVHCIAIRITVRVIRYSPSSNAPSNCAIRRSSSPTRNGIRANYNCHEEGGVSRGGKN
jgi:hypothetical protein